ncbi:MAG: ubiquitin-specific protease doa4 [Pycnora praestabilis]|nr:MAG: ubiquitin-specific protease doa4 [Pycnora praestabilis]
MPGPPPGDPRQYLKTNNSRGVNGLTAGTSARNDWAENSNTGAKITTRGYDYPHIKDLIAKAIPQADTNAPIGKLLREAEGSAKGADRYLDFGRKDLAYIEYLRASNIIAFFIPKHKDAPSLLSDRGDLWRLNKALIKEITLQHETFDKVKRIIEDDNKRSGVQPSAYYNHLSSEPRSSQRYAKFDPISVNDNETLPLPKTHVLRWEGKSAFRERPLSVSSESMQKQSPSSMSNGSPRRKPALHSKPESLHGRIMSPSETSGYGSRPASSDELAERFARLRSPEAQENAAQSTAFEASRASPGSRTSSSSPHQDTLVGRSPRASHSSNYTSSSQTMPVVPQVSSTVSPTYSDRPSGPRFMPAASGPPHPPKIPLNTRIVVSMPRAPSPTYSPARNLPTPTAINPPRSTARSIIGTGGRSNSMGASTTTSQAYNANGESNEYVSAVTNRSINDGNSRRPSADLPYETAVSVEKLYDYLKRFDILLIDVRTREAFDDGHIFARSIMCIEPAGLRVGMPAEDLEDGLILSPDQERDFFHQRDQFELIVYYDQSTTSSRFLNGSPNTVGTPSLRALYDAVYEFSYQKPIKRPPVFLIGGIDAWVDLVGEQALKASNVADMDGGRVNRPAKKLGRPIAKSSRARLTYNLESRRMQMRDYNPLNSEEEKAWLEKAQHEGDVAQYQQILGDHNGASQGDVSVEGAAPVVHSYDEFLRRFPETSTLQQSMVAPVAGRPQSSGPYYNPSTFNQAPLRPAPAVPRKSYSGVSEKAPPQSAPSLRSAPSAAPLYFASAISASSSLKLPRTGLINFGVTCYMNATIQCLSATTPLTNFFLDNSYRSVVQRNWKGSQGVMPEYYANVVRSLWKGDVEAIRPSSFRKFCTRLKKEWGDNNRQQDAKEFLEFLIDCLHEDFNVNWSRNPLRQLTLEQESKRERMPMQLVSRTEWDRYSHREFSFISNLFAGQHASRLRCTTCRNTSTTYEAFFSLSVEIPRAGIGDIRECLRSYCQEEKLSGDEVWRCPYCKCEREATKQITLTRAPQFLVVHFKRFSASRTESARKIHTPIEFPLHNLDIQPFMLPPMSTESMPKTNRISEETDMQAEAATKPPFLYDAYAVMRHIGYSVGSGHYIALTKDSARGYWREFNDHNVTDFEPSKLRPADRLQNEQAYIVFYARVTAR